MPVFGISMIHTCFMMNTNKPWCSGSWAWDVFLCKICWVLVCNCLFFDLAGTIVTLKSIQWFWSLLYVVLLILILHFSCPWSHIFYLAQCVMGSFREYTLFACNSTSAFHFMINSQINMNSTLKIKGVQCNCVRIFQTISDFGIRRKLILFLLPLVNFTAEKCTI